MIAVLVVGAAVLFEIAARENVDDRRFGTGVCLVLSAVAAAVAVVVGWRWLAGMGASPVAHSYGATLWTLAGYAGLHVAMGAAMALWCLARLGLRMIDSWRSLTLHVCRLWWRFTAAGTLVTLALVVGFPHVVA